jgi:class 3 adenylate cyclase
MNLASRLCDEAAAGQVLMSARAVAAAGDLVETDAVGDLTLKGFGRPVAAFSLRGAREAELPTGVSEGTT